MKRIGLATIVLIAGAFSGCIAGDGTMPAKAGVEAALEAAEGLTDGVPQLVGVASLETFTKYVSEEDDFEIHVHLDDTPGDGLAPGWLYAFQADDDFIVVGYAKGLGVLFEMREGGESEFDMDPIKDWKVDSDEAAKALKAHELWPEHTSSTMYTWELGQAGECPMWAVESWDVSDEDASTTGIVDGCTGEVVEVAQASSTGFSCGSSWVSGSGNILPVLMGGGGSLSVGKSGPATLAVDIDTSGDLGTVDWLITGPAGFRESGTGDFADTFEGLTGGQYQYEFSTSDLGGRVAYEFSLAACDA